MFALCAALPSLHRSIVYSKCLNHFLVIYSTCLHPKLHRSLQFSCDYLFFFFIKVFATDMNLTTQCQDSTFKDLGLNVF